MLIFQESSFALPETPVEPLGFARVGRTLITTELCGRQFMGLPDHRRRHRRPEVLASGSERAAAVGRVRRDPGHCAYYENQDAASTLRQDSVQVLATIPPSRTSTPPRPPPGPPAPSRPRSRPVPRRPHSTGQRPQGRPPRRGQPRHPLLTGRLLGSVPTSRASPTAT